MVSENRVQEYGQFYTADRKLFTCGEHFTTHFETQRVLQMWFKERQSFLIPWKVKRLYVFGLKQMCQGVQIAKQPVFFFFVSHTVSVTTILAFIIIIQEEWRKKILKRVQSPVVLNHFEKEVVLFLVFISFQDACLPLCTQLEISL